MAEIEGKSAKSMGMTVNAGWRVCFIFKDGDAHDVEIVDYPKG
jgi:toxin HigB-1